MTQTESPRAAETARERIQRAADKFGWWRLGTGHAVRLGRGEVTYTIVFNAYGGVSRAAGPEGPMRGERSGQLWVSVPEQIVERLAAPRSRRF